MTKGELINLLLADVSPLDTKIFIAGHSKGIFEPIYSVYTDNNRDKDNRVNPTLDEIFVVIEN